MLKPEFEGKDEQAIAFELGADNIDEAYELRPTLQHMKPSDALVLKMLEAFDKKYRPHQTVEVTFGGRLQLEATRRGSQGDRTSARGVRGRDRERTARRPSSLSAAGQGQRRAG